MDEILDRLTNHFEGTVVAPPATEDAIEELISTIPDIPEELLSFYRRCDGLDAGLDDDVVGIIYSVEELIQVYTICFGCGNPFGNESLCRLLPLRGDGCGDRDCLVAGPGVGEGAVVFWDHEIAEAPAYLLAGSLMAYLGMWSDMLISCYLPNGEKDKAYKVPIYDRAPWFGEAEKTHPWPFDKVWLRQRDPGAPDLLDDPAVQKWLLRQGK